MGRKLETVSIDNTAGGFAVKGSKKMFFFSFPFSLNGC